MTIESGKQAARDILDRHEALTGPIQKEIDVPVVLFLRPEVVIAYEYQKSVIGTGICRVKP